MGSGRKMNIPNNSTTQGVDKKKTPFIIDSGQKLYLSVFRAHRSHVRYFKQVHISGPQTMNVSQNCYHYF